jgi:hypothetical protein
VRDERLHQNLYHLMNFIKLRSGWCLPLEFCTLYSSMALKYTIGLVLVRNGLGTSSPRSCFAHVIFCKSFPGKEFLKIEPRQHNGGGNLAPNNGYKRDRSPPGFTVTNR